MRLKNKSADLFGLITGIRARTYYGHLAIKMGGLEGQAEAALSWVPPNPCVAIPQNHHLPTFEVAGRAVMVIMSIMAEMAILAIMAII